MHSHLSRSAAELAARALGAVRAVEASAGQATVMLALVFVPLFAMSAVAVGDIGATFSIRRDNQSTADLAALAAVPAMPNATAAEGVALAWLARNGFDTSDPDRFEVTFPAEDAVRVTVMREHTAIFARFVGRTSWTVSASATAQLLRVPLPFAIMTMSETGCARLTVEGAARVNVPGGGGTYTRSNCPSNALDVSGRLETGLNEVVGGTHVGGSGVLTPPASDGEWRADPYRDLEIDPAVHRPAACHPGPYVFNGGAHTITPGRYCQRLAVSGGANITVAPGVYWLERGVVVDSASATFRTASPMHEVLFYSTCPSSPCNGTALINPTPTIRFAGAATTSIKGHSEFRHLLFWVDRTAATGCRLEFEGASASGLAGSVYAVPCHSRIAGAGGADLTMNMAFVTGSFTAAGNARFTLPYDLNTAPYEVYPALVD